jgi:DNA mismatch repair protein MutS2
VRGLFPSPTLGGARAALAETSETLLLVTRHGRLPLSGVDDPGPALESLASAGGLASPEEMRALVAIARAVEAVRALPAPEEEFPRLARRLAGLPELSEIVRRAAKTFDADGTLSDGASPKLSELRSRLRRERQRVYEKARTWLSRHAADAAGDTVVLRDGRYCLPLSPSAAPRVAGIVHDRSASGQTVFVEPLEMTAHNNEIALLSSDVRREEERIRREFGAFLLTHGEEFESAAGILTSLDSFAARAAFAAAVEGVAPEFSEEGRWTLAGARHPLLDARLAALRRDVLSERREEHDAVPLDIDLAPDRKWILISGPNAGGKTVVLKTLGLFSQLAQAGFHLPARAATLPVFSRILASVGDDQAILSDLSTFSSSMRRIAEILRAAGPETLALFDELGSGTDPEEGAALAVAVLETYRAAGGRAVATTHLSAVKEFAAGRQDAQVCAMEFDESTGRPTYRLHPGLLGRSRALATAAEEGLPQSAVARAREILGQAWVRRERLETEAEETLARLRARETELSASLERAREREDRLRSESEELERRREKLLREGHDAFERARRQLRAAAAGAVEEIRKEKLSRAQAAARVESAERDARETPLVREAEELAEAASRELLPGASVRLRDSAVEGRLVELDGERAWIEARGKRIGVPRADLVGVASPTRAPRASVTAPEIAAPTEVNVIGCTVEEAIDEVERAIGSSIASGADSLRIVHGHGTGRLRSGLRGYLRRHPAVALIRAGADHEGGEGATVAVLK